VLFSNVFCFSLSFVDLRFFTIILNSLSSFVSHPLSSRYLHSFRTFLFCFTFDLPFNHVMFCKNNIYDIIYYGKSIVPLSICSGNVGVSISCILLLNIILSLILHHSELTTFFFYCSSIFSMFILNHASIY
jgi:hypothetical protein